MTPLLASLHCQDDFDGQIRWVVSGRDPVPFNWGQCASMADMRALPPGSGGENETAMLIDMMGAEFSQKGGAQRYGFMF